MTVALMIFLTGVMTSRAQSADSLFRQFESRFMLLDSIIHHPASNPIVLSDGTDTDGHSHISQSADIAYVDSVIDNSVRAKISAARSVTGLSVNGQIYGRLDDGFGLDEDDALSRYKSKIQADIRWNIFGSALINRKGKANEIRIKGEIDKLDYRREDIGRLVAVQKELFRVHYDSLLSGVLVHRINNLSILNEALSYLLNEGGISSDDLLQVLNEKAEAERLMATIANPAPSLL